MQHNFNQVIKSSKNFSLIFISLFFSWILIWFSIGTNPSDIYFFGENVTKSLNALRILLPLSISFLLLTFYLISININLKKFFDIKFDIFFIFILYFASQAIGLIQNEERELNLDNTYLIILGSETILIYILLEKYKLLYQLPKLIYINLAAILFAGIVLTCAHLSKSTIYDSNYFSLYNSVHPENQIFLSHELPRVTGISRLLAVCNLTAINFFFWNKEKINKNLLYILIFFLGFLIYAFQSRGTILCFFLVVFFLIFVLIKKYNFYQKIIFFFFIIILPLIFFEGTRYFIFKNFFSTNKNLELKTDTKSEKIEKLLFDKNRLLNEKSSSGRIDLWKESLNKYSKSKLFGYGPQADRFLIGVHLNNSFGNNVSNGYVYSFLCGGYIGLFFFIIINCKIIYVIYKKFFIEKIFYKNKNFLIQLSSLFLFFFIIRSIFENSFSVFSVDLMIVITSIATLTVNSSVLKNKS